MIVLDTQALLWADTGAAELGPEARRLVQEGLETGELGVSALSFWKCAMLVSKRRLALRLPPREWRQQILETGLVEFPLDGDTAAAAVDLGLPGKDPADRFIVATALARGAELMTADQELLGWRHPLKRHDARR